MRKLSTTGGTAAANKKGAESSEEEVVEPPVNEQSNENDDLYYFSAAERKYKVFDAQTKTWSAQDAKPSAEQVASLRTLHTAVQQEEQKIID